MPSAPYIRVAIVSILSTSGMSSGYRKRNSLGSSHASATASASSTAPLPPRLKCVATVARAPSSAATWRMACFSLS